MSDDDDDPRLQEAVGELNRRLKSIIGRTMNGGLLDQIDELLRDTYTRCKWRGIAMPKLTAFVLPTQGHVDVYRADLEASDIRTIIIAATKRFPKVTPREIALAVQHAWPQHRQGIIDIEARSKRSGNPEAPT